MSSSNSGILSSVSSWWSSLDRLHRVGVVVAGVSAAFAGYKLYERHANGSSRGKVLRPRGGHENAKKPGAKERFSFSRPRASTIQANGTLHPADCQRCADLNRYCLLEMVWASDVDKKYPDDVLMVRGLPRGTDSEALRLMCDGYGTIQRCVVQTDRNNQLSSFGLVSFEEPHEAMHKFEFAAYCLMKADSVYDRDQFLSSGGNRNLRAGRRR